MIIPAYIVFIGFLLLAVALGFVVYKNAKMNIKKQLEKFEKNVSFIYPDRQDWLNPENIQRNRLITIGNFSFIPIHMIDFHTDGCQTIILNALNEFEKITNFRVLNYTIEAPQEIQSLFRKIKRNPLLGIWVIHEPKN